MQKTPDITNKNFILEIFFKIKGENVQREVGLKIRFCFVFLVLDCARPRYVYSWKSTTFVGSSDLLAKDFQPPLPAYPPVFLGHFRGCLNCAYKQFHLWHIQQPWAVWSSHCSSVHGVSLIRFLIPSSGLMLLQEPCQSLLWLRPEHFTTDWFTKEDLNLHHTKSSGVCVRARKQDRSWGGRKALLPLPNFWEGKITIDILHILIEIIILINNYSSITLCWHLCVQKAGAGTVLTSVLPWCTQDP